MGMILTLNFKFSAKVQFKTSATWTCAVLHLFFLFILAHYVNIRTRLS